VLRVPVRRWYTYICPDNESEYLPAFGELLRYRYGTLDEIRSIRSRKDLLRMGRDWGIFQTGKRLKQQPLIKDPFAVFSALWFAERLDSQVVICVRHPAACASSLKRLGWSFDFSDLLEQPLLMRDWLEPYREEMLSLQRLPEDVVGQSSLLWRMIYETALALIQKRPDFILVRHEDLSLDPLEGYRLLYEALGLPYTEKARQKILRSSSTENPAELSKKQVHSVNLDSRANLHNWKRRLSREEICRVRELAGDTADRVYPDLDWE
jgi:hypothetical protein